MTEAGCRMNAAGGALTQQSLASMLARFQAREGPDYHPTPNGDTP